MARSTAHSQNELADKRESKREREISLPGIKSPLALNITIR
jgi:hypothetical protein